MNATLKARAAAQAHKTGCPARDITRSVTLPCTCGQEASPECAGCAHCSPAIAAAEEAQQAAFDAQDAAEERALEAGRWLDAPSPECATGCTNGSRCPQHQAMMATVRERGWNGGPDAFALVGSHANGFGEPGDNIGDWSAWRDSSPKAVEAMFQAAQQAH